MTVQEAKKILLKHKDKEFWGFGDVGLAYRTLIQAGLYWGTAATLASIALDAAMRG